MATCSQCGSAVTEGAPFCPVCGTPQTVPSSGGATASDAPAGAGAPPTGSNLPPGAGAPPAGAGFGTQPGGYGYGAPVQAGRVPKFAFDPNNMTTFDWVAAGGSLLLFICLFLPWYSISGGVGGGQTVTATGSAIDHGYMYLALIFCLALIAYYVAKLGWGGLPFKLPFPELYLIIGLSAVNLLLAVIAFFDKIVCIFGVCGGNSDTGGGIGWSFGAFIGLLAAIAAVAGIAWPLIQQQQQRAR